MGQTIQYVKRHTSSTEFVMWNEYLDNLPNEFDPLYWYLANIAKEIERNTQAQSKHPKRVKLEDKLLKFERKKVSIPNSPSDTGYDAAKIKASKTAWLAGVGLRHKIKEI